MKKEKESPSASEPHAMNSQMTKCPYKWFVCFFFFSLYSFKSDEETC